MTDWWCVPGQKERSNRYPGGSTSIARPGVVAVATAVVVVVRPAMSSSSLRTAVLGGGSGVAALLPLPFPFSFSFPFSSSFRLFGLCWLRRPRKADAVRDEEPARRDPWCFTTRQDGFS